MDVHLPHSLHGLSYGDAVRILGADNSKIIAMIGQLAGFGTAATSAATLSTVDLLGVQNAVVNWSQQIFRTIRNKMIGLNRFDRNQRINAAHTVIVINAFFEAVGRVWPEMGEQLQRLKMSRSEQVTVATRNTFAFERSGLLTALVESSVPMPSPAVDDSEFEECLFSYFHSLGEWTVRFARDFSDNADNAYSPSVDQLVTRVAKDAVVRYGISYRMLAVDIPEFAVWASLTDAARARAATEKVGGEIRQDLVGLHQSLRGVENILGHLSADIPSARRQDIAKRYRQELHSSIFEAAQLPGGVVMPPTGALYVNPRAKVKNTRFVNEPIATEGWWAGSKELTDIEELLVSQFTGLISTRTPLLVLGQPGAGKSMLSRILAARLPVDQFLALRVELRAVHADGSIQSQIESAIHQTIGERVSWPDLVRSAAGALPVVIFDGFDELLQASGVNRANYLEQITEFQEREAGLSRPVAVVVTSRTVVADRARVPRNTTVLRLEPFSAAQIEQWLAVWAEANERGLGQRSLMPLSNAVALRYQELAQQPLLLLMLALYDAWDNALQKTSGELDQSDLYERLFTDFARREIGKREPHAPPDQLEPAVARELRHLELVAVGMFARGAQVIHESQLDDDLAAFKDADLLQSIVNADSDHPLSAAQLLVGRFFFVHESKAHEGVDRPVRSFEFLHATFGEFLVARLVVGTLVDLIEEEQIRVGLRRRRALDFGPLSAWLSFGLLTARASILEFCRAFLGRLPTDRRLRCHEMLLELLRESGRPHPTWSMDSYQPVLQTVSKRHAVLSANLVTLLVQLGVRPVSTSAIFPEQTEEAWRSMALLWKSQLAPEGWDSLWRNLRMTFPESNAAQGVSRDGVLRIEDGSQVRLRDALMRRMTDWKIPKLDVEAEGFVGQGVREAEFEGGVSVPQDLAMSLLWLLGGGDNSLVPWPIGPRAVGELWTFLLSRPHNFDMAPGDRLKMYSSLLQKFSQNASVHILLLRMLYFEAARFETKDVLALLVEEASIVRMQATRDGWTLSKSEWVTFFEGIGRLITQSFAEGDPTAELTEMLQKFQIAENESNIGTSFAAVVLPIVAQAGPRIAEQWALSKLN